MHQICDNMLPQVHLFLRDCTKKMFMKTMKGWATLNDALVFVILVIYIIVKFI